MKKQIIFLLAIVMFLIPQYSFAKSKIQLAKDYINIGEISAAGRAIREAILEDPSNSNVHYQAGMLYLRLGILDGFERSMNNACKLDSQKCSVIAQKYFQIGIAIIKRNGNNQKAINFIKKSIRFMPGSKQSTCNELSQRGKAAFDAKEVLLADAYFNALRAIDKTRTNSVIKLYIEKVPKVFAGGSIFLLKRVINLNPEEEKRAAKIAVELAKNDSYGKGEKAALKQFAKKHLSKKEFSNSFPPDTIYLEPNKLYVSPALKKGETSKLWIDGPLGIVTTRHIGRRGKKNLALLLDNGKVYNYTQGELPPKGAVYKFKFIGLEDGAIGLAKYTTD